MQLVADRFAIDGQKRVWDLATGMRVTLIVRDAGGVSEQMRWTVRCDRLHKLQQRAMASLVDFGIVGETSRFEAWRCGALWRDGGEARLEPTLTHEAARVRTLAEQFLRASGCTTGLGASDQMHICRGSAVWVPDAEAGYALDGEPATEVIPLANRGMAIVDRPAVSALAEIFHDEGGPRPDVTALWGPHGSGKTIAVRELARIARLRGFVPVASRLVDSPLADLWHGRSLFIIDDESGGTPWPALLQSAIRTSQPHVLLLVGEGEVPAVDGVALGRIGADALASSICPRAPDGSIEPSILRAAERAQGLPGRFAQLLWPRSATERRRTRLAVSCVAHVAEQPAIYGADERLADDERLDTPMGSETNSSVAAIRVRAWPAPGELAACRRRMAGALAHLARGRHAPGIRLLRQAIGGLARRDDWPGAADGALALASTLLRRGRVADAEIALGEAREYAARVDRPAMLIEIATLAGETLIDRARLDQAESVLGAALAAARSARDPARVAGASLALARCLFWRGLHADAAAATGAADDLASGARGRHDLLVSRIAVGQRDPGRAMVIAQDALQRSRAAGDALATAAAAAALAFVHLAVGDLDAVDRDVAESLAAARAAHDPLRAIRARLLLAEAERRRGRPAVALKHLHRLRRIAPTLPPILRARLELGLALTTQGADPRGIVDRHVAGSGLGALGLYVPDGPSAGGLGPSQDPFVNEVVAILRVCQTADEEAVVLKDVCARVRQQLHAAAVAFVGRRAGRPEVVVADGGRVDLDIADRTFAAGISIAPHRRADGVEAAAPVHYGGEPIAALCVRWTLGSTYDVSRAATVLTMAAAAAAPMVFASLPRQDHVVASGVRDLVGMTPGMSDLRTAISRAAAAPFAVLIDGESGSGKELVARAIHRSGPRRGHACCTLNCAALPDDLIEAELFGHARGAFTGAVADRPGVFEEAHGGTLFLDEIGELSPRAQAKLLRVVQEGELRRVGENLTRRVDARIVSATNRDLRKEVEAGRFRVDLLYRLDVIRITVPALRDRRDDIAVLADHFWRESTERVLSRATLAAGTLAALARYDWPGNVRELQNVLAALAARSPKRGIVPPTALPPQFADSRRAESWRLEDARRTFEERFVRAALVRSGGHRARAAAELGVTRQGLAKLVTRLRIGE